MFKFKIYANSAVIIANLFFGCQPSFSKEKIASGHHALAPFPNIVELSDIDEKDWQWLNIQLQQGRERADPKRCKVGDKRYVYWAAGDKVFRLPYLDGDRFPYYPSPQAYPQSDKEIPPAPDSGESLGCYLNPYRGSHMPYIRNVMIVQFHKVWGRNLGGKSPDRTGFFAKTLPKNHKEEADKGIYGKLLRMDIAKRQGCSVLSSGMEYCWTPSNPTPGGLRLMNGLIKLDRKMLSPAPGVGDVIYLKVRDLPGRMGRAGGAVVFEIYVYDDLILAGAFYLDNFEEMNKMLIFLNGVIDFILDARVHDYNWKKIPRP